ncbi:hypothetical protein C9426_33695, partial [Serratia sp. S1B]
MNGFYYNKFLMRFTALTTLLMQLLLPIFIAFTPLISLSVRADGLDEAMSNMRSADILSEPMVLPEPTGSGANTSIEPTDNTSPSVNNPFLFSPSENSKEDNELPQSSLLPNLGSEDSQGQPVDTGNQRFTITEDKVASASTQAWGIIGNDNRAKAAESAVTGVASGLASQAVSDWLGQFGNARVQLNSSGIGNADLLLPVAESSNNLLFGQLGVRYNGERTTNNIGFGVRQFVDNWMFGVNTFYDYDLTGKNSRWGIGGEAWTDNLKLSANGYFRLTDWHQSVLSEMEDYDERPANGFDIRAVGYLPSYPQLGASLMYEKYFGDGVALNSGSTRPGDLGNSPSAYTVGVNYTPIPLVSVELAHKHAQNANNELQVGLNLNYRFGVPWIDQINTDTVGIMRSLAGSRYDLVDRNYNIVMQYKKQDLILLSLPENLAAFGADVVSLTGQVTAKYGAERIEWSAPTLLAAGGSLIPAAAGSLSVQIALPPYQSTAADNSYQISGVAYDVRGNRSNVAITTLLVKESPVQLALKFKGDGQPVAVANGTDHLNYGVTVVDNRTGTPVVGEVVAFSASLAGAIIDAPSPQTSDQGTTETFIKHTKAGEGVVEARLANGNRATAPIKFMADPTTATIAAADFKAGTGAKANGTDANVLTVVVKDANDNPVPDIEVDFDVSSGAATPPHQTVTTGPDGVARAEIVSEVAADNQVRATVNGNSTADKSSNFISGDIAADKSTLEVSPPSITANGREASTLTLTLVDANKNLITGAASSLRAAITGLDNVRVSNFVEQSAGVYVAALTGTKAGVATIMVMSGSKEASMQTPQVTLSADQATAHVSAVNIHGNDVSKVANGVNTFTYTVTVTDSGGNKVPGVTVVPASDKTGPTMPTVLASGTTNADGEVTITLTSSTTAVADITVSAQVGITPSVDADKTVSFIADSASAKVASVALVGGDVSKVADGINTFTYTVTVKDSGNNPVPGVTVEPASDKGHVAVGVSGQTNSAGEATITLTSSTTAVADITVSARVGSTDPVDADKTVSF